MLANGHAVQPTADLNERELEVLRLLAAGHTVKTIAAELGRSEASINERLREARRKTGAGSSRELARRLGEQKIWDRNFDLPPEAGSANDPGQPGSSGRPASKGIALMLLVTSLASLGLVLAAAPAEQQALLHPAAVATAAQSAPTIAGHWMLDVASIPAEERPQRVVMAFLQGADRRWSTAVEIVAPDGSTKQGRSVAATDGVPVPITGNLGFADSVALRQPAPNSLVMTLRLAGQPVSTRVYTVAKDGRSLTETIVWPGQDAPKMETTRFVRVE
jgi:DNA-binding CsgD family transcriptional regulator